MSPNEIKQSVIDIVHQETWKTASLTTAAILSFGLIIAFVTKNWFLNWIQNRVSHGFNQQLEAYRAELQQKAANYQNEIQQKFEMFKTVTSQIQDRRTRSNEKEYDACLKCWSKLFETFSNCEKLYSGEFRKIARDIENSEKNYQIKCLENFGLPPLSIENILSKDKKDYEYYIRVELYETICEKNNDLKNILRVNSIFFDKDLYDVCSNFSEHLDILIQNYGNSLFNPNHKEIISDIWCYYKELNDMLDHIENSFRTNLHIRAAEIIHTPEPTAPK